MFTFRISFKRIDSKDIPKRKLLQSVFIIKNNTSKTIEILGNTLGRNLYITRRNKKYFNIYIEFKKCNRKSILETIPL